MAAATAATAESVVCTLFAGERSEEELGMSARVRCADGRGAAVVQRSTHRSVARMVTTPGVCAVRIIPDVLAV
eukprot:2633434-Pleurochrysis_carterae.AAC.4